MRQLSFAILVSLLAGCGAPEPVRSGGACTSSVQCGTGELCSDGRCVPVGHATESVCTGGVCCPAEGPCFDPYVEACGEAGCTCFVLHDGGGTPLFGAARRVLSAGQVTRVDAYAARNGATLPPGPYDIEVVEGHASFFASGAELVATQQPGRGRIAARFGTAIRCEAEVVNLGPAPDDGRVRVYVFDERDGTPVAGAHVVIDVDGDGKDDGDAPATDANGVTTTRRPLAGAYDLTVFAPGYNYVSVLGQREAHVTLALAPRPAVLRVGGASGVLDFSDYEARLLDGQALPFRVGITSVSFPLERLLDFDPGLLLGGPLPTLTCEVGSPGCYTFSLPGLFESTVPLWGGVVLSLAGERLKPFFEVVGEPGRRYVWSLAGEFSSGDVAALLQVVLDASSGGCACEGSACEPSCDAALFTRLLRALAPMLAKSASGVHGNLPLAPVPYDHWLELISQPYGEARAAHDGVALLDEAGAGPLAVSRPLGRFAELALPELPADPAFPGRTMEGVVALTGVVARGAGYVPLGLAMGFDCTGPSCWGHARGGAGYDGQIDPQSVCGSAAAPLEVCPEGVPEQVAAGRLGLFYAPAHDGLAGERWRTVLLALPVDSLDFDALRLSALVLDGEPSDLALGADVRFPEVPAPPERHAERGMLVAAPEGALARVTLVAADVAPRWVVLAPSGSRSFRAPEVPEGFVDPWSGNEQHVRVVHLRGAGLQDAGGHILLVNSFERVTGFASARYPW